jgi:1-aminocyclopropane-1-carboxylate deaminase
MLTRLGDAPVAGVSMSNVALLRLDTGGGLAPGNKQFKLRANLAAARRQGINRLVSFGGAWSNHLHALAAVGAEQGFATVGIVRGADQGAESATLADARRWGMQIVRVSREEYRRRHAADYLAQLQQEYSPCLVIPEGGANTEGARGCMGIAGLIRTAAPAMRHILVPVGTGTTLAGLVAGLDSAYEVTGVAALKGATDLEQRTGQLLERMAADDCARWQILHDYHCGGFARASSDLREFILAFEAVHGVALDPVYTGKMLYAVHQRLRSGEYAATAPLLAVHTGGLQGRRGYSWLAP